MKPNKPPGVQRIENLLLASYCAFLGAASPASAKEKLQEWDQLCVTEVQTTKTHEEILAVLNGARSGSDTEFIIFGRLLATATSLDRYVVLHHRIAEKLTFAEVRSDVFSDNTAKVRAAKLKTLKQQVFDKWDEAAFKQLGTDATHEQCHLISRSCPQGGKTSAAIADRLAAIATEEHRLAEQEKAKEQGSGDSATAQAV